MYVSAFTVGSERSRTAESIINATRIRARSLSSITPALLKALLKRRVEREVVLKRSTPSSPSRPSPEPSGDVGAHSAPRHVLTLRVHEDKPLKRGFVPLWKQVRTSPTRWWTRFVLEARAIDSSRPLSPRCSDPRTPRLRCRSGLRRGSDRSASPCKLSSSR
jgi:hypothetical protein